jgi:hypothetical protein
MVVVEAGTVVLDRVVLGRRRVVVGTSDGGGGARVVAGGSVVVIGSVGGVVGGSVDGVVTWADAAEALNNTSAPAITARRIRDGTRRVAGRPVIRSR